MRARRFAVVATLATLAGLLAAAPGDASPAILVGVHEIRMPGKGRPGPTAATCTNDGPVQGLYALTGWRVTGDQTAYLNTATVPQGLGSVTAALQASFDAWRASAAVPRITVSTGGSVTRATANRRYDLLWGRTGGSTIAVTYTWRWSDGFVESDTVFNARLPWFQAPSEGDGCYESEPRYDVANIATHEFGHVYGLDHPGDDRFETMYAYGFTGETLKRSPASGDLAGIAAVYP
jgi:hypothetical protein